MRGVCCDACFRGGWQGDQETTRGENRIEKNASKRRKGKVG